MAKTTDHLGRPVVAVTGIGVVTSLGVGKADNWEALTSGRSGIHDITRFPTDHLNTRIAGTVDFLKSSSEGATRAHLRARRDRRRSKRSPRPASTTGDFGGPLFLASPPVELDWKQRFKLYSAPTSEADGYERMLAVARGLNTQRAIRRRAVRHDRRLAGRAASAPRGLPITLSTACASGATAIQLGVEAIRRGESDARHLDRHRRLGQPTKR